MRTKNAMALAEELARNSDWRRWHLWPPLLGFIVKLARKYLYTLTLEKNG